MDGIAKNPDVIFNSKPIADLFTATTVLFADISGFTAWSSVREPAQVFTLLETVYHNFDEIATRRRIFKVETVGDCYVAVAGLPGKFFLVANEVFTTPSIREDLTAVSFTSIKIPERIMRSPWPVLQGTAWRKCPF